MWRGYDGIWLPIWLPVAVSGKEFVKWINHCTLHCFYFFPSGIDDWISSNTSPHHFAGRGLKFQRYRSPGVHQIIFASIARGCRSEKESTIFVASICTASYLISTAVISSLITFSCDGHDVGPRDTNQAPAHIRPSCLFPKPSHHGTGLCSPAWDHGHIQKQSQDIPKRRNPFWTLTFLTDGLFFGISKASQVFGCFLAFLKLTIFWTDGFFWVKRLEIFFVDLKIWCSSDASNMAVLLQLPAFPIQGKWIWCNQQVIASPRESLHMVAVS